MSGHILREMSSFSEDRQQVVLSLFFLLEDAVMMLPYHVMEAKPAMESVLDALAQGMSPGNVCPVRVFVFANALRGCECGCAW